MYKIKWHNACFYLIHFPKIFYFVSDCYNYIGAKNLTEGLRTIATLCLNVERQVVRVGSVWGDFQKEKKIYIYFSQ